MAHFLVDFSKRESFCLIKLNFSLPFLYLFLFLFSQKIMKFCLTILIFIFVYSVNAFYPLNRFEDDFGGGMTFEEQPDFDFYEPTSKILAIPEKKNYYMHVWRNIMEKMPAYKSVASLRSKRQPEQIVPNVGIDN